MKTARIILALLFAMGVVATLFSKIENSGKFAPAKIPDKIYFEEHDGGILIIYVKDGGKTYRIDTRSSVYSKYKIRQVSKDFLFLDSSDIGKYMITDAVSKNWDIFHARDGKIGGINAYVIYAEKSAKDPSERKPNTVFILFESGGAVKKYEAKGYFHPHEPCCEIDGKILTVRTGMGDIAFDLGNGFESITKTAKPK